MMELQAPLRVIRHNPKVTVPQVIERSENTLQLHVSTALDMRSKNPNAIGCRPTEYGASDKQKLIAELWL
jgi:hypothetical protein